MRKPILIPISKDQREIVIGTILGDGCLEFNGNVGTRLQIKQSYEHKDYVFWLYKKLKNLCMSGPKQRKDNNQWYFSTRSLKELTSFYNLFYKKRIKIIPQDLFRLLISPLSLAIWYMDDGTLDFRPKQHLGYRFNTHSFTLKENYSLLKILKNNFGVDATVHTTLIHGKRYPRIHIGKQGREKFLSLVKPHIIKCFSYKLP